MKINAYIYISHSHNHLKKIKSLQNFLKNTPSFDFTFFGPFSGPFGLAGPVGPGSGAGCGATLGLAATFPEAETFGDALAFVAEALGFGAAALALPGVATSWTHPGGV